MFMPHLMNKVFREIAITLGIALFLFLILHITIESAIVQDICMLPGLSDGQRVIVNKITYHFEQPERGDVITLRPPIDPDNVYIKRIIGLPGDIIEIHDQKVYLNKVALSEPYVKYPSNYVFQAFTVPENNYFVLGDNRVNANDSHMGWTVTRDNILGKAWITIWPLSKWGLIEAYPIIDELKAYYPN